MDPRVYEMWVKYCEKYDIENCSEYFEKIIKEKLKKQKREDFYLLFFKFQYSGNLLILSDVVPFGTDFK
jgi:hypothetical protein